VSDERRDVARHRPDQLEALRAELVDSGLWPLLDDPDVTDVMVNAGGAVFAQAQGRGSFDTGVRVEPDRLESIVATIAGLHGLEIHDRRPILEASLPFGAIRVEAVLRPLVEATVLTLRKPPAKRFTLDDLVANGSLPSKGAEILQTAVRDRANGLIAGGVGSGKTTLLTALLHEVVVQSPTERLVVCEDGARELVVDGENVVRLLTSDDAGVDLRRLLRCALRLNPDRIIVGEARGPEALDWLKACNTGHPGGWLTLHANSATDAVYRLDDLIQEAGVPSQLHRIAAALDLLVFVEKETVGRRVGQILRLLSAGVATLETSRLL
jgi:type IV secretion system protein TrbB